MSALAEIVLGWLAETGGTAVVLAALVLAATVFARGRLDPRWQFGLWALVLLRLAMPIAPPAPWQLFPITNPPASSSLGLIPDAPVGEADPGPTVPIREPEAPAAELPPPEPSTSSPALAAEPPAPINWRLWLAGGWLTGAALLLARHALMIVRLGRQRRGWSEPDDPAVRDLFDRCRREFGVRRSVQLLIAPGRVGPATDGAFRARVVIPADLVTRLTPAELRLVLLHELAHVRRWDVLTDRLAALVATVHWFNPAGWLALAGLRRARELACDAAVLRRLGPDSAAYGHALLTVAADRAARLPATVGALGKDRTLDRRIRMIASYSTPTAARRALGGVVFVLLAAIGLTDAAGRSSQAPPADRPTAKDAVTAPVHGVCQDPAGEPITGARVTLYREDYRALSREKIAEQETGADGQFAFADAPSPAKGHGLAIVVTKAGRGSIVWTLMAESLKKPITVPMRPAATLQGRVTDAAGKPIAGARVWSSYLNSGPVDGVLSAVTDADGKYAITDMGRWTDDDTKPKPIDKQRSVVLGGCFFDVRHPDYGHERPMYHRMPDKVDVILQPGGVIEGKVLDKVTGKPAVGAVIGLQAIKGGNSFNHVGTDAAGKFEIRCLKPGQYNLWADAPDRACAAIDSLTVEAGKTLTNQNLELVEGGWVEGQIVDAATGAPIGNTDGRPLEIAFYGPARPKSGGGCQAAKADAEGRFRQRVPPGKQFLYIMESGYWERTQRREFFDAGIDVKADEIVRVVLRVLPAKPLPDPEPTPVRLTIPVPAEREAAARVRELGGWYQVDVDGHVVELNMDHHQAGKQRFDNPRKDTDEGLRAAAAFPRLKRLMLSKGQATDEGLKTVRGLTELEWIYIWDGKEVTDAGIAHLAGLTKLKRFYLDDGQLGDASLGILAGLPALEEISAGRNAFTDDGLKHLAGMKNLRRLYLGMNKNPLTEAGLQHLAGLTGLTRLDLQFAPMTDAGVAALKDMKNLQTLWMGTDKDPLTDASADVLAGLPKLQHVIVRSSRFSAEAVERLAKLPDLKELSVGSSAISEERREALGKEHKDLRLYATGP
jgi:beta-lactamase regulating signal transducer with metallopeptidase domain/5-hydroxyisourate hydrolase-like protein (transthyretin family)